MVQYKLTLLIAIMLIAAQPMYIVEINNQRITAVEQTVGEYVHSLNGDWMLQLVDENNIYQQHAIDPYVYFPDKQLEPTIISVISYDPRATALELRDENEQLLDIYYIESICGDGICTEDEQCELDCTTTAQLTEEPFPWGIVLGAVLMIIILTGILFILNRKKPQETSQS